MTDKDEKKRMVQMNITTTMTLLEEAVAREKSLLEQADAEYPHRCKTCNGLGFGYAYTYSSDFGYDADVAACPDCIDKGVDSLNINKRLLADDVSPTAGFCLTNEEKVVELSVYKLDIVSCDVMEQRADLEMLQARLERLNNPEYDVVDIDVDDDDDGGVSFF